MHHLTDRITHTTAFVPFFNQCHVSFFEEYNFKVGSDYMNLVISVLSFLYQ